MSHNELLIGLAGLALIGLWAMWSAGRKKARKAVRAAQDGARVVSLTGRCLALGGVLTVVQYAVITYAHNLTLTWVTLAVPSLLAAATVVRALTVSTIAVGRGGGRR